ncbi:MAG: hypothetical protein ACXWZM_11515 [Solirubrobacterales bacterium]
MPELLQRGTNRESQSSPPSASSLEGLLVADERLARVELRRQIARLERELAGLFASAYPRREIEWGVAPAGGPRMLGVGELEEVRDALAVRVAEARGEIDRRGEIEEANRELLEWMIAEPAEHKWVRISNEDIGETGCRHWHSRPRFGLLGMLMGWWRVKHSSGCPL